VTRPRTEVAQPSNPAVGTLALPTRLPAKILTLTPRSSRLRMNVRLLLIEPSREPPTWHTPRSATSARRTAGVPDEPPPALLPSCPPALLPS
jgi:hypothetical protein